MSDAKLPNETLQSDEPVQSLCPGCLFPNPENAHFCSNCNSPLSSHAAIDPLLRIFATGHLLRKAVSKPQSQFVYVGMWFTLGTLFVFNLLAVWEAFFALISPSAEASVLDRPFLADVFNLVMVCGMQAVWGILLFKVERNHRLGRKSIS